MSKNQAVAYFRTSSAANVGADKDSERRQREAVMAYAKAKRLTVVEEFNDAAVSGADPIDTRPGFVALLDRCKADGISIVLVENASRFARDMAVHLAGHALLQQLGIELVPVDAPTYFSDPSPTAEMVRGILTLVSQFDKKTLVAKLRHARDHKRATQGRCEGRKPVPADVVALAKKLARVSPKTGKRRTFRAIAAALADAGYTQPTGKPYLAYSVQRMIQSKPMNLAKAAA